MKSLRRFVLSSACTLTALGGPALAACSGQPFSPAPGTAGTSNAGASSGGSSGGGGDTPVGGTAGQSSGGAATGGSTIGGRGGDDNGGTAGSSCNCDSGQYCRAGTCRDCSDYTIFEFGEPELLQGVSSNPQGSPSFPRSGPGDSDLFYSTLHPGDGQIFYTAAFADDEGEQLGTGSQPESGPLYIGNEDSVGFNFLFSRAVADSNRDVMTATWDGQALVNVTPAPAPINQEGVNDFEVAFAAALQRFWWVSDRDGYRELMTAHLEDSSASSVPLEVVSFSGNETCVPESKAFSPWVSAEGDLLLFSAYVQDDNCFALDGGESDLYAVQLNPSSGQIVGTARPISDLNVSDRHISETTPSLSPDRCWLYYAATGGALTPTQAYRAPRR